MEGRKVIVSFIKLIIAVLKWFNDKFSKWLVVFLLNQIALNSKKKNSCLKLKKLRIKIVIKSCVKLEIIKWLYVLAKFLLNDFRNSIQNNFMFRWMHELEKFLFNNSTAVLLIRTFNKTYNYSIAVSYKSHKFRQFVRKSWTLIVILKFLKITKQKKGRDIH